MKDDIVLFEAFRQIASCCKTGLFPRILLGFVLIAASAFGKASTAIHVCDNGALNAAVDKVAPGTIIVMCSKTWPDVTISIAGNGTAAAPIKLVAAEPGKVVLTGSSTLSMGGNYIEVDGLTFSGRHEGNEAPIKFKARTLNCNHCRLTNSSMIFYNPSSPSNSFAWVAVNGQFNRVDHNYFSGKTNLLPIVNVRREGTRPDYHRIDHNFFSRPAIAAGNGGESVKIGQDDSLSSSYTIVEDNYFYQADGEIELISVKASGNTIRHNTVDSSQGGITLRQGNGNLVDANFILGHNRPMTSGIRVAGKDHVITNNYISGINPDAASRGGIVLVSGDADYMNTGHVAANNVLIASNTIVDSERSIVLGSGGRPVTPANITVANNIFYRYKGDLLVEETSVQQLNCVNNIVYGGSGPLRLLNALNLDPQLVADQKGIARPMASSPALNAARDLFKITKDMDGQVRRAVSDVGADQREDLNQPNGPISRCEVGPATYDPSGYCGRRVLPNPPEALSVS
jgi:hypothetical protein